MPGYEALRRLTPEQHEAATKLVAEAMASIAFEALSEPQTVLADIRKHSDKPLPEAFKERAADFLDIRGDLTDFVREGR